MGNINIVYSCSMEVKLPHMLGGKWGMRGECRSFLCYIISFVILQTPLIASLSVLTAYCAVCSQEKILR